MEIKGIRMFGLLYSFYIVAYGMFGVADETVPMGTRLTS